jgi:hypothetical protein
MQPMPIPQARTNRMGMAKNVPLTITLWLFVAFILPAICWADAINPLTNLFTRENAIPASILTILIIIIEAILLRWWVKPNLNRKTGKTNLVIEEAYSMRLRHAVSPSGTRFLVQIPYKQPFGEHSFLAVIESANSSRKFVVQPYSHYDFRWIP